MERAWIIVSVLGLGVAAVTLLTGHYNAAFVAGALGAVAWFLNYRARIRPTLPREEMEEDELDEEDGAAEDEPGASHDEDEK